ncbi:hypothetical protein QSJ19_21970 [Gordonia sp. ABSL11-1]|uniref:hypothetical protein n=1 Tax=Gordonia sp. ABSL11-1 TaxID=3053924 RepID=UPI0025726656|nr:hypothetical protein [Gordonia sp. ABSL11-1]MDL9948196.1 hypothetical protein [Gordonia sp. ABSL11-1]
MTRPGDSLGALRDQAVAGVEDLVDVLALSATLGGDPTDPDMVHRPFRRVGGFDARRLAADAHRLAAAHHAVADHLHRLPEQQVRLGRGWTGDTGMRAVAAVIEHQRRAESDLHGLRTLAEATGAASSGIDQLLRTWYLTVARLSAPLVAGVPIAEVPEAIVTGRVPLPVVVEDIASRARLYFTTAEATVRGIDDILDQLNRVTETMDLEPYPDAPAPASATEPPAPASATEPGDPSASDVPLRLTPDGVAPETATPDTATPDTATPGTGHTGADHTGADARTAPAEDAGLAARPASPATGPEASTTPEASGRQDAPDRRDASPPGEASSGGDLALAGEE